MCTYFLLKKLPDNERIRSPHKASRVAIALVSTGWLDIYSMINENINGNFCRSMFNRGNDFTIDKSLGSWPEVEDQPEDIQGNTIEGKIHLGYKK